MIRLWRNAWNEFVPFLEPATGGRFGLAGISRLSRAAMKCLYLVTRSLNPTGTGNARWTMRWKPVINAFAIILGDRWPGAETY